MSRENKRPRLDLDDPHSEDDLLDTDTEDDDSLFEIQEVSRSLSRKYGVEETVYTATFNEGRLEGRRLIDLTEELRRMFTAMLRRASERFNDDDLARLTISHRGLEIDIVVHLRSKNRVTPDVILDRYVV